MGSEFQDTLQDLLFRRYPTRFFSNRHHSEPRFANSLEDQHPDAHAVRCKLALSVAFVEDVSMPMELHLELVTWMTRGYAVGFASRCDARQRIKAFKLKSVGCSAPHGGIYQKGIRDMHQAALDITGLLSSHLGTYVPPPYCLADLATMEDLLGFRDSF